MYNIMHMTVPAQSEFNIKARTSWKILWKNNRALVAQEPKFFWYFFGIAGIFFQAISLLSLAGWQLIKIAKHDYLSLKSSIAVASLFLLFVLYLVINIWKTVSFRSTTLGGVLCCEILFIPVGWYLLQSHQIMIAIIVWITILITTPIFFMRAAYCAQHTKRIAA